MYDQDFFSGVPQMRSVSPFMGGSGGGWGGYGGFGGMNPFMSFFQALMSRGGGGGPGGFGGYGFGGQQPMNPFEQFFRRQQPPQNPGGMEYGMNRRWGGVNPWQTRQAEPAPAPQADKSGAYQNYGGSDSGGESQTVGFRDNSGFDRSKMRTAGVRPSFY